MQEPVLTDIKGVGEARAALLESHGFTSVIAICEAEPSALHVVPGYKEATTRILQANARALLEEIAEQATAPPEPEESQEKPEKKKKKKKKADKKKKKDKASKGKGKKPESKKSDKKKAKPKSAKASKKKDKKKKRK